LRVLIPERIDDPIALVRDVLTKNNLAAETRIVPASLEDVFVAVTQKDAERERAA
jgi:hypothetical protein